MNTEANIFAAQLATVFFCCALFHTFMTSYVLKLSRRFPSGSLAENLLHFLSEIEIVFGFWAFLYLVGLSFVYGTNEAAAFLEKVSFAEPAFVFVIMCMAATKPVMDLTAKIMEIPTRLVPRYRSAARYLSYLIIGPCLGSLITEPAAMTVTALLLKDAFLDRTKNQAFKYATLGLLFVNVSIGGTLTHFAAPPVVMVADTWGWSAGFMFTHFGWKACLAVMIGATGTTLVFWRELVRLDKETPQKLQRAKTPLWMSLSHIFFIVLTVLYHTKMPFFIPLFLIFLGWAEVTKEHQAPLKIRESLLVGFFLGGLVTLGNQQGWWLQPLLEGLGDVPLFLGATALTAVTDNAALTYLGSLVPSLSETGKYLLVAGAVTGGGLTIVANAPNPAGYGILKESFGAEGISALKLFVSALPYTIIALLAFWFI